MSGRQANGVSSTAIPPIEVAIEPIRDDVAEGCICEHGSPQTPVIRVVTADAARHVDSRFTGQPAALERRVDALAGQRIGEPAGVTGNIDRACRRT